MKATLVREYTHPDKQYADAAGNMQVLPNGNVFVGWGRALAISEFSEDGVMLFDATLQRTNESYRAFRFSWSARPSDQPAAVAERVSEVEVRVYASWNGATEVATWAVLAGRRQGRLKSLGEVPETDSRRQWWSEPPIRTSPCEPRTVRDGYSAPPRSSRPRS